jgi:pimeloyl-ACP methyl ester carboxylesterase
MRIEPFTIAVPQARLDRVLGRLADADWPTLPQAQPWVNGMDIDVLRDFIDHILHHFDWRAQEAKLNAWPQFMAQVEDQAIHFLHVKADIADAPTVILSHGWPGAYVEFLASIDRLTHPERHGGAAQDAVHLVIPSLPGYGFSPAPSRIVGAPTMARQFNALLTDGLGLEGYIAQGGDYGSVVSGWMAYRYPACRALHLNYNGWFKARQVPQTPDEQAAIDRWNHLQADDRGYAHIASTRPFNLAYAFADSPLGAAAWILTRYQRGHADLWSVYDKDALATLIMIYLLTGSLPSSMNSYRGLGQDDPRPDEAKIDTPTAFARFPAEVATFPRSFLEASFSNIVRWSEMSAGGHFAALEQPELFSDDLTAFCRQVRGAVTG